MQPVSNSGSLYNPFVLLRKTYDWTLLWAEHRRSQYALCVLAFIESIFFPVPTDVLLLLMGASQPKRALYFAGLASFFSVLGGVGGYFLGYLAWQFVEPIFMQYIFSPEIFEKVRELYNQNAFWSVFTAAFTPIPFKVFTVAAGVFEVSFWPFLLGSAVGRPLRFFAVGGLLYFFGAPVKDLVERYFNLVSIVFTVLLIAGFAALKYLL